jgi:tellurite resistance protein
MKEIILYTKKIKLNFDSSGVSVFNVQELIDEVEKEYKMMDANPAISTFEEFQYITFRVVKKDLAKKPLGFSFTN